ncbi:extensin family protein, partial [Rhizobium ruizarguesonis]
RCLIDGGDAALLRQGGGSRRNDAVLHPAGKGKRCRATSYMCRLRNGAGTGKISEHARGNAIDIASFNFEKGEDVAVSS